MTTAYLPTPELSHFATKMKSEEKKTTPTKKRGRPSKSDSTHNPELTQLFSSPISTSSSSSEAVRKYGSPKGSPLMRILKEGKKSSSPLCKREMLPPNLKISPELNRRRKQNLPVLTSPSHYDYRSHVNPSLLLSSPSSVNDVTFNSTAGSSVMSPLTPHSHFANVVQSSPMFPGYIVSTCSDLEEKTRPKIEKSVSTSVVDTPRKRQKVARATFLKECKLQLRIGQDGKARVATETCMASRPVLSHHLSMEEIECHLKLASDPVLAGAASDDDISFLSDTFDGLDSECDAKQALLQALKGE